MQAKTKKTNAENTIKYATKEIAKYAGIIDDCETVLRNIDKGDYMNGDKIEPGKRAGNKGNEGAAGL